MDFRLRVCRFVYSLTKKWKIVMAKFEDFGDNRLVFIEHLGTELGKRYVHSIGCYVRRGSGDDVENVEHRMLRVSVSVMDLKDAIWGAIGEVIERELKRAEAEGFESSGIESREDFEELKSLLENDRVWIASNVNLEFC